MFNLPLRLQLFCIPFLRRSTFRSNAHHPPPISLSPSPLCSLSLSRALGFSEMKQELAEEGSRCSILSKQHRFNEHCCIRCCAPFTFLLNPKRLCLDCQYNVCKTCCTYSKRDKAWLCTACQKGRLVFSTHVHIHTGGRDPGWVGEGVGWGVVRVMTEKWMEEWGEALDG